MLISKTFALYIESGVNINIEHSKLNRNYHNSFKLLILPRKVNTVVYKNDKLGHFQLIFHSDQILI